MSTGRILRLNVNGVDHEVAVADQDILLDVLREKLHLTGTKRGCDMGTCGCCTVDVDGEARLGCLTLAAQASGHRITTIEGLARGPELHPVQRAFSDVGGSQCGFCTPGFIMATNAFLVKVPNPDDAQIKEALSGNLCRCTGYIKIIDAVKVAARELAPGTKAPAKPLVAIPKVDA